jgi:RNA-directed DNA polymerase
MCALISTFACPKGLHELPLKGIAPVPAVRTEIFNTKNHYGMDIWQLWIDKELNNYDIQRGKYLKKGYLHFDDRYWLPSKIREFKEFISDSKNICNHSFLPFLKVTLETKRIKYSEAKKRRCVSVKERPICYAAHIDSLIYSFYATVLDKYYEDVIAFEGLSDNILAYRSLGKNNIDFSFEVFKYIEDIGKTNECVAIALDVKSFFDTLNHNHLKNKWLEVLKKKNTELTALPEDHYKIFRSVTKYAFCEKNKILESLNLSEKAIKKNKIPKLCSIKEFRDKIRTDGLINVNIENKGIPQGSPISAILSNIYMLDYDRTIAELANKENFLYRRYCDDIVVVCRIEQAEQLKAILYKEIERYNLTIQPEKEEVVYFRKNTIGKLRGYEDNLKEKYKSLQYLGFEYNGLNAYIRSSSISRYHRRLRSGIRETIKRAYGKKSKGTKIFRQKLYHRFSHLGKRNFIAYAHRSLDKAKIILNSTNIKNQVAQHFNTIKEIIKVKKLKIEYKKKRKGKLKKIMS